MKDIKIKYSDTFGTIHSHDYYKGKSFHYAGEWIPGAHYFSDDYNVDFIVKDNCLLACSQSHFSTIDNEPKDFIYNDENNKIGIASRFWDFVLTGLKGDLPQIKVENNVWWISYDNGKTWEKIADMFVYWGEQTDDTVELYVNGERNTLVTKVSNDSAKNISYSDLFELRNNKQLSPGCRYRITDYVATTTDLQSRSANHPFDIIVTAVTEDTLSEECEAALHEGDVYFENANLAAWRVRYTIDNDKTRFNWADTTNGKGVIYRLIDERNNDVPYDFKGIQFKRYRVTAKAAHNDTLGQLNGLFIGLQGSYSKGFNIDKNDYKWYYTFSRLGNTWEEEVTDATLDKNITAHRTKVGISYASGYYTSALNNIVFANGQVLTDFCLAITPDVGSGWINTKLVSDTCVLTTASNNLSMFGDTCHCFAESAFRRNIFFGLNAQRHSTIGSDVQDNTVIAIYDSSFNHIGSYFSGNILFTPASLVSNNMGNYFRDNTITNLTSISVLAHNDFAPGFKNNTIEGYIQSTHTSGNFTNNTGTGLEMSYCTFNDNFHDNILNNRIVDLDCSGQITYCEFNGILTNCTFGGIFTYVIIPTGTGLFAHIDVRGGIRGTEQVPATLDASQFRIAAVTGNTRRITIESDVDKSIVATWLENGKRVGIYKYAGDAEWKSWLNLPKLYCGSGITSEQKAHNLEVISGLISEVQSGAVFFPVNKTVRLDFIDQAPFIAPSYWYIDIYQIGPPSFEGEPYTVFYHWRMTVRNDDFISGYFQTIDGELPDKTYFLAQGNQIPIITSVSFTLGNEGEETTQLETAGGDSHYESVMSVIDGANPHYSSEGSFAYGFEYDNVNNWYECYFDKGDRTIRLRVYGDDHITTLWRYKVDAVDLVILDGGHAPSP